MGSSLLLPTFLQRLADPSIRTVMLCGCGGGFDFVHSLLLYPELVHLGKHVVIASYSFGDPAKIGGEVTTVFEEDGIQVRRVSARSIADPHYGPEIHVCSFLDERFPERAPHHAYAYYARAFCADRLRRLYQSLVREHAVDALVLVDGGSDSLMVGDEAGLGDPVEDAVSVAAVASLQGLKARILVAVGLGADRFNDVSDASTLRAVAELTRSGGYLGAVSLEPTGPGFELYRACIGHVNARQTFRSVIAGTIVAATRGEFGRERLPPELADRVQVDSVFLWPLMAMLWAFDVERVAERSLLVRWVRGCESQLIASAAVEEARRHLGPRLRGVEDLPRHGEMRRPTGRG